MSKKTLQELVAAMQNKSMTYGWDAVTLYDQRKANELLFQLYVERFNTEDGYIEPATMEGKWGNGDYVEHIFNLKLSAPRLSFESADPSEAARARLTMDMIGGMIISTEIHSGGARYVSRILNILPVGGPQLWMDQPVTKGDVTGTGDVVIDISNADRFMANFVIGDLAQEQIGARFREFFEKEVKPEQKRFPLGTLSGESNGVLTPKNFEIRTMKSDPIAVLGDVSYGDGAVMMFITLKGGEDGKGFPNANSQYLLPADEGGTRYTGAMLLSSRVLFDKIMRGPATDDIGNGITFRDYTPENGGGGDVAWSLKGASGGVTQQINDEYYIVGRKRTFEMFVESRFIEDDAGAALTVKSGGGHIEFFWNKKNKCPALRVVHWDFPSSDEETRGNILVDCQYSVKFDVVLDRETGVVSFQHNPATSSFMLTSTGWEPFSDPHYQLYMRAESLMTEFYKPVAENLLKHLSTPTLDTFLLRNLLFPGHNALQLSDAFVPGDLAVFGQIDPLRTTLVLKPGNSTLEAGQQLQFTLTPMPDGVEWSVKDVDGNIALPGVISSTGLYVAPLADELPDGFVAVMVTAKGTLNGQAVQSSALVSVLLSAIVANPLFDSCDAGNSTLLTAEAMSGERLEWEVLTQQQSGSRLEPVPDNPNQRTFIAGEGGAPDFPFLIDKVQIKKTTDGVTTIAYIHVLVTKSLFNIVPMYISSLSDPSTGTVQFELKGKNGPIPPEAVTWKLLSGEGEFNNLTGEYTDPAVVAPGSFIIVSGTLPGDFTDIHAITAAPLPLSKYAELIATVNLTLSMD